MGAPLDDAFDLSVATPERVALRLPLAGIGYRTMAYLIDVAVLFAFWLAAYFLLSLFADVLALYAAISRLAMTVMILGAFFMQWVYWTLCEVAFGGQTLGKRWMRIRVVRADGAPVGFFESALRNLLRAVDFLPLLYATGVVTMLLTQGHRRLGDLAAGTVLVRDEQVPRSAAALSELRTGPSKGDDEAQLRALLARADSLSEEARLRIGTALLDRHAGLTAEERAAAQGSWERTRALLVRQLGGADEATGGPERG